MGDPKFLPSLIGDGDGGGGGGRNCTELLGGLGGMNCGAGGAGGGGGGGVGLETGGGAKTIEDCGCGSGCG